MNSSAPIPEPLANDSGESPSGFRSSRARAEQGAGSREQGAWNEGSIRTSSRSVALAVVIESIRPDWAAEVIGPAIAADDRPWRTVVLASIRGAALTGADTIRHPNGLRYVNPDGTGATPTPMALADWRRAERCEHGALAEPPSACCRKGLIP